MDEFKGDEFVIFDMDEFVSHDEFVIFDIDEFKGDGVVIFDIDEFKSEGVVIFDMYEFEGEGVIFDMYEFEGDGVVIFDVEEFKGHEFVGDESVILVVAFEIEKFDIGTKILIYVVHHYNKMLIFGWIGGVMNAFHVLPQVVKIYRTKSTQDISFYSLIIKVIASITYTIHGIIINDPPLLYMTGLMVLQYSFMLGQYKYYYKSKQCDADTAESDSPTTQTQNMQNAPHVLSRQ